MSCTFESCYLACHRIRHRFEQSIWVCWSQFKLECPKPWCIATSCAPTAAGQEFMAPPERQLQEEELLRRPDRRVQYFQDQDFGSACKRDRVRLLFDAVLQALGRERRLRYLRSCSQPPSACVLSGSKCFAQNLIPASRGRHVEGATSFVHILTFLDAATGFPGPD